MWVHWTRSSSHYSKPWSMAYLVCSWFSYFGLMMYHRTDIVLFPACCPFNQSVVLAFVHTVFSPDSENFVDPFHASVASLNSLQTSSVINLSHWTMVFTWFANHCVLFFHERKDQYDIMMEVLNQKVNRYTFVNREHIIHIFIT